MSRAAYVHAAVLTMDAAADDRAPGAAVTQSLCGSWEHDGPCPVAPHHTSVVRDGRRVDVRVLFAVEPEREESVRRTVVAALSGGTLATADGRSVEWRLASHARRDLLPDEQAQAARLADAD